MIRWIVTPKPRPSRAGSPASCRLETAACTPSRWRTPARGLIAIHRTAPRDPGRTVVPASVSLHPQPCSGPSWASPRAAPAPSGCVPRTLALARPAPPRIPRYTQDRLGWWQSALTCRGPAGGPDPGRRHPAPGTRADPRPGRAGLTGCLSQSLRTAAHLKPPEAPPSGGFALTQTHPSPIAAGIALAGQPIGGRAKYFQFDAKKQLAV